METTSLPLEAAAFERRCPRILVVDDDHQYRDLVVKVLQRVGLQVDQADDGLKALKAYSQGRLEGSAYDLVLLDLGLPVMGGWECLQKLVEMDQGAKVMITSGSDPFGELPREIRALAKSFMQKPFGLKDLVAKVENLLGQKMTA